MQKLMTVAEFRELAKHPAYEGKQIELDHGELIVTPPSSHYNSGIALQIGYLIKRHLEAHDLGRVTGADGGYSWAGVERLPQAAHGGCGDAGGGQAQHADPPPRRYPQWCARAARL